MKEQDECSAERGTGRCVCDSCKHLNVDQKTKEEAVNITSIIKGLVRESGMSAYDINNGSCDLIADEVERLVPGAESVCTESFENTDHLPGHIWILYKGKRYDAEVPRGVNDWGNLPIFKKFLSRKNANDPKGKR